MVPTIADIAKTRYLLAGLISLLGLYFLTYAAISLVTGVAGQVLELSQQPPIGLAATQGWTPWLREWLPWFIPHLAAGLALIIYAEPIACLLSPIRRQSKCPRCRYSLEAITEPRCPECGLELTNDFVSAKPAQPRE